MIFSQVQDVELRLEELHATFDDIMDKGYHANFNIITFSKNLESTKSKPKASRHNAEMNKSYIDWIFTSK